MRGAEEEKARPVSFSIAPELLALARERAEEVGLPFSRYVALCVRADLEGQTTSVLERRSLAEGKPSVPPEEITTILQEVGTGFACTEGTAAGGGIWRSGGWTITTTTQGQRGEELLGRMVLLQRQEGTGLIVVAPYLRQIDAVVREALEAMGVRLATPDTLGALLATRVR